MYRHLGQALLLLSFAGVEQAGQSPAVIAAALRDWLAFLASAADWRALAERQDALEGRQLQILGPLALARHWQERLAAGRGALPGPATERQAVVQALLAQLQDAERGSACSSVPPRRRPGPAPGLTCAYAGRRRSPRRPGHGAGTCRPPTPSSTA
ncbi:hypothetical protein I0D68_17655 [Pseudomonas lalucatii]|nr:hypothetical protein [Pseudomonas lalucatii]QVM87187.1 hypothetical protein I0D68_17655 [Pseudomonas lalucatii]